MSTFEYRDACRVVAVGNASLSVIGGEDALPDGYVETGIVGSREQCIEYIESALLGVDAEASGYAYVGLAAQTRLETVVLDVWRRRLSPGCQISVHDRFFDLGANSLMVVEVCADLSARLGVRLPEIVMFQCPTVHSLAAYLSKRVPSGNEPEQTRADRLVLSEGGTPIAEPLRGDQH